MVLSKYIAVICEGSAEEAIMNILLDNHLLVFEKEDLIEEKVLRCRSGKTFEKKYLRKNYENQISIIRILDSHRENFKLSRAYAGKVDIINVVTAPEIEMLIIHNEDKYADYKKSGKKPSLYCKENLGMKEVKQEAFVYKYFSNPADLLFSIKQHYSKSKTIKGEHTIYELLKNRAKMQHN